MTGSPDSPDAGVVAAAGRRGVRARLALAAAGLAVVVPLALVGLRRVDAGAIASAFEGADPALLAAAVAFFLAFQTAAGGVWATCQAAGGVRGMPPATAVGIHWATRAACEVTPAGLGETARVALSRRHPAGARAGGWRIVGAVAAFRALDTATAAVAALAVAVALPVPDRAAGVRGVAGAALAALALALLAWRLGLHRRVLPRMPARVRSALLRLAEGARGLRDPGAARRAAALAALAIAARLASLACLLAAFGISPAALGAAFVAIVLAGSMPVAPGAAGTRELLVVPTLVLAWDVPAGAAIAFSLSVQAVALSASLAVGLSALAFLWPRLRAAAPGDGDAGGRGDGGAVEAPRPAPGR